MEFGEIKRLIWDLELLKAQELLENTVFLNSMDRKILQLFIYYFQYKEISLHELWVDIETSNSRSEDPYYQIIYLLTKSYVKSSLLTKEDVSLIEELYSQYSMDLGEDWKFMYQFGQAFLNLNENNYDKVVEISQNLIEFGKTIGFSDGIARCYNLKAHAIFDTSNSISSFNEFEKIIMQGIEYCDEISQDILKINLLTSLAHYSYLMAGQFQKSIDLNLEGLRISEKHNLVFAQALCLEFACSPSLQIGEIDAAVEYNTRAFKIMNQELGIDLKLASIDAIVDLIGDNFSTWAKIEWIIQGLGKIARFQDDHQSAIKYFNKTLKLRKIRQNKIRGTIRGSIPVQICYTSVQLVNALLHVGNRDEVLVHINFMHELQIKDPDNLYIHSKVLLAESLYLKKSTRMKDRVKAQELLKEGINRGIPDMTDLNFAFYNLCDLLIEEFQIYGDENAFEEATSLLDELLERSTKQSNVFYEIEALLLRSKFSLYEGKLDRAENLFERIVYLSNTQKVPFLSSRIDDERKIFAEEIDKWKKLHTQDLSIQEKLKRTELQIYISKALNIVEKM